MPLIFNPMLPFNFEEKDDIRIFVKDEEGNDVDITEYVAALNNKLADKVNTFQGATNGNKVMITDPQGNITTVEGVVMNISEREKLASLTNPVLLKGIINSYEALYQVENPQVGWCYYVRFANGENDNIYEEYVYTADHGWELFGHFNASAIPQYFGGTATEINNTFHVNLKYDPDVFEVDAQNRLKLKDLSYVAKCKTLAEINALSVNEIFHWQGANDQNIVVLDPNGTQTYIRFGYFYKKGETAIQRINKERESNAKEIVAGENISITEDAQNDRITINANYDNEDWGIGKNNSNQLKINGKFVKQVEDLDAYTTAPINEIVEYIGETDENYTNGYFYKRVAGEIKYVDSQEPLRYKTINIPSSTPYIEFTNINDSSIIKSYQLDIYENEPSFSYFFARDGYVYYAPTWYNNSDFSIGGGSSNVKENFGTSVIFDILHLSQPIQSFYEHLSDLIDTNLIHSGYKENTTVKLFTVVGFICYIRIRITQWYNGSPVSTYEQSLYFKNTRSVAEAIEYATQQFANSNRTFEVISNDIYLDRIIHKDGNGEFVILSSGHSGGGSNSIARVRKFINENGEYEYLYSNSDGVNSHYFIRKIKDDVFQYFNYFDADIELSYNQTYKETTEAITLTIPELYDDNDNYLKTFQSPSYWKRIDVQLHNVVMMYLYDNIASYYPLVMCTEENGNLYEPQQPDSPNPAHRVDYEDNVFYYATNTNKVYTWSELDQTIAEVTNSVIISGDVNTLYIDTLSNQTYRYNGSEFVKLGNNDKADEYPTITEAQTRTNIEQGDSVTTIWGKIKKFFADLKAVAFSGSYNDLIDKPTIPTAKTYTLTNSDEKVRLSDGTTNNDVSLNTLINGLSVGNSDPVDADYYISQYVNGGTTTTTYHRRPMSAMWNWIKSKLGIAASGSTYLKKDGTWGTPTNTWRPLGTGASDACAGNDSRLSNSRPASDVYAWAKSASLVAAMNSAVSSVTIGSYTGTNTSSGVSGIQIGNGAGALCIFSVAIRTSTSSTSISIVVQGTYKSTTYAKAGDGQGSGDQVLKLASGGYIQNESLLERDHAYYCTLIGIRAS